MDQRDRDVHEPVRGGFFQRAIERVRGRLDPHDERHHDHHDIEPHHETPEQAAARGRERLRGEREARFSIREFEGPRSAIARQDPYGDDYRAPWPERGTGWGGPSRGGWDEDSSALIVQRDEALTIGARSGAYSAPATPSVRDRVREEWRDGATRGGGYEHGLAMGEHGHPFGPREWERQWSAERGRWSEHDPVRGAWTDSYEAGEHRNDDWYRVEPDADRWRRRS
jgi:hypothetical protein